MIKAHEIKLVDTDKLSNHPKNNHKHSDEQIKRLTKIIEYQGFRSPIVVSNLSGYIVAGHARLQAAKKAGINKVPVIYQDFDNEDQEYAHMTADNAMGKDQWAEIDLSQINAELENLGPDMDLEMLGLKEFKIDINEEELDEKPNYDEEKQFVLEAKFPNEMEMMDYHDDLLSRGYIVKVK